MKHTRKLLKLSTLACLLSQSVFAFAMESGRVALSATASKQNVVGIDALQPIYAAGNNFFYADLMGSNGSDGVNDSSSNTYLVSPGLGYRHISNNQIYGAYFFTDYEKTSYGEQFWVLNPGIEWMSSHWDAHFNVYLPTNNQQAMGSPVSASSLGDYSYDYHVANTHDEYDMMIQQYDVIGGGVDSAIGYSFENENHLRSRVYLGSYYYESPSNSYYGSSPDNILGVTLGYENAVTKNVRINVTNSYDQVTAYTVALGITFTFGGETNTYSNDVHDRLDDEVSRHIGIIGTGAGTYDQTAQETTGSQQTKNNVYFVSDTGSGNGDGTFGNEMTLDDYNDIPGNTDIYIQQGSYTSTESLNMKSGQTVTGRSTDYSAADMATINFASVVGGTTGDAMTFAEPSLNGFVIDTEGDYALENLTILGNNSTVGSEGVAVTNTSNGIILVNLDNVNISGFNTNMSAVNSSTGQLILSIYNSSLGGTDMTIEDQNVKVEGLSVVNNSSGIVDVTLVNSQFNDNSATATGVLQDNSDVLAQAYGVSLSNYGSGSINLVANNTTFNNNNATSISSEATGVNVFNAANGTTTLLIKNDSQLNGNNAVGSDYSLGSGLYVLNNDEGKVSVQIENSELNNNSGAYQGAGVVLQNNGSGELNLTSFGSAFNNNQSDFMAFGLTAQNYASGSLSLYLAPGNEFNNNSADVYAAGLSSTNYGDGDSTLIITANNDFSGSDAVTAKELITSNVKVSYID